MRRAAGVENVACSAGVRRLMAVEWRATIHGQGRPAELESLALVQATAANFPPFEVELRRTHAAPWPPIGRLP
jgi:hypothetical protein